jgi:hypothetical protein
MRKKRLCLWSIVFFGLAACKTVPTKSPNGKPESRKRKKKIEVAEPIPGSLKAYIGSDGIKMVMLKLEDGTYLVRVTGANNMIDAKVLPCHHKNPEAVLQAWSTSIDGMNFHVIQRRVGHGGKITYYLNLPRQQIQSGRLVLKYDSDLTEKIRAKDILAQYRASLADGSLAALQRFDRARKIKEENRWLNVRLQGLNERCGTDLELEMDWDSVSPHKRASKSIHFEFRQAQKMCSVALSAVKRYCKYELVRKEIKKHVRTLKCTIGSKPGYKRRKGVLHWTAPLGLKLRDQKARRLLVNKLRWTGGKNLADLIYMQRTVVCTDGKGSYVGMLPQRKPSEFKGKADRRLFFSSDNKFRWVKKVHNYLTTGSFFDPRYPGRGKRRKYISYFQFSDKDQFCAVKCGSRVQKLKKLSPRQAARLVNKAKFVAPMKLRKPYGLARNRRGIYFYVDRAPGNRARDFRLYRGPLGKLKQLKMTNIVSDTKGDVFATTNGKLRLVLEKEHSFWIRGRRKEKLINVPIRKNLGLIYNDLGVYLGKPLGTPCDAF